MLLSLNASHSFYPLIQLGIFLQDRRLSTFPKGTTAGPSAGLKLASFGLYVTFRLCTCHLFPWGGLGEVRGESEREKISRRGAGRPD